MWVWLYPVLVTAHGNSDLVVAGVERDLLVSALKIFSFGCELLAASCGTLVPRPGIELRPPALEA